MSVLSDTEINKLDQEITGVLYLELHKQFGDRQFSENDVAEAAKTNPGLARAVNAAAAFDEKFRGSDMKFKELVFALNDEFCDKLFNINDVFHLVNSRPESSVAVAFRELVREGVSLEELTRLFEQMRLKRE